MNLDRELLKKRLRDKTSALRDNRQKRTNLRPLENYSITDTIKELMKDKKTMSVPRLNAKYIQLRQEHEPLYKMVLSRDISEQELKLLENMVHTRENVRDGNVTEAEAKNKMATEAAELFAPHLLRPATSEPVQKPVLTPVNLDSDSESDSDSGNES